MRVLHVISSIRAAAGGPVEALRTLSAVHQHAGHTVEVASLDNPDNPEARSFPLTTHALGPGRGAYAYSPHFVPWVQQSHANYDAVIVHGLWQYHSFGTWRALARSSTPYYVFPHGMLDPWFKRSFPLKHLKKWLYWPWADYRVLRDARAVLFTCEEERQLAADSFTLYRAKAVVIGLGTLAPPAADGSYFFGRFPQLRERRIILFMGRLHPKKGCDLLIEAFAATLAADPEWRLVFAGPDEVGWQSELVARVKELGIADRVIWTGMLRGVEKWAALHAAEVFALPSHQENFGIAVAEALACRVPVLISRAVNIWREIDGATAGLVAPDTLAGTTDLLRRWQALADSEREAMRQNARACFIQNFSIEQSAARLMDLLEENQHKSAERASLAAETPSG